VAARDLPSRIARRAVKAGVPVGPELADRLAAYLLLLARWNRKINLTALGLDPPDDEAIDRLVIEPIAAAKYLRPTDALVVDVGSGGGSPALPMKLAAPRLRFVLVESKVRKAAFLREAVRQLVLDEVEVENRRAEDVTGRASSADLVTVRAVKIDAALMTTVGRFLRPGGRVFAFGTRAAAAVRQPSHVHSLVPERRSELVILAL
jgi:16S rRNA (guanine527-N7)-methyltransferase